jgi:hypothetical protein
VSQPKGLTEIAWAAGFVDGEGCVSIAKSGRRGQPLPYYRAELIVANTVREPLDRLALLFGGRVVVARRAIGNRKLTYQWKTTGTAHTTSVLRELLPWLTVKRAQAALVLEFAQCFGTIKHQQKKPDRPLLEVLKNRMHVLNMRGVA